MLNGPSFFETQLAASVGNPPFLHLCLASLCPLAARNGRSKVAFAPGVPQLAYGSCNAFTWFAFQQAANATDRSHQPVVRARRIMSNVRGWWYQARQRLTGQPEAPPPDTLSTLADDDYRWVKFAVERQPKVSHQLRG